MKTLPKILSLLLGLSLFTLAQSDAASECPAIEVIGPAGLTQPGERMTFTVNGSGQPGEMDGIGRHDRGRAR